MIARGIHSRKADSVLHGRFARVAQDRVASRTRLSIARRRPIQSGVARQPKPVRKACLGLLKPPRTPDVRVARGRVRRRAGEGEVVLTTGLVTEWNRERTCVPVFGDVEVTQVFESAEWTWVKEGTGMGLNESGVEMRTTRLLTFSKALKDPRTDPTLQPSRSFRCRDGQGDPRSSFNSSKVSTAGRTTYTAKRHTLLS